MSERMTNERIAELVHTDPWAQSDCADAEEEMLRARAAESQQQDRIHALEVQQADLIRQIHSSNVALDTANETVRRQTETIKSRDEQVEALADALEMYREACGFMRGSIAEALGSAALRLAGRLP